MHQVERRCTLQVILAAAVWVTHNRQQSETIIYATYFLFNFLKFLKCAATLLQNFVCHYCL